MTRVVIDTSVWIRYLIRSSVAIQTLIEELWLGERVQVITAPELHAELQGVLARPAIQHFVPPAAGQVLLKTLQLKAVFLPVLGEIPAFTRDPKDDKFIACALAGQAQALITVDKDLLILEMVEQVRIVTPDAFIRRFHA
ncbi:MAG TPA: putative toxin-antitoxin system toxin component, PIN family [Anaerolineae bacterium]|nr:putative toxin-antitoxin system toxin component, PIN family [Anaerolineae bacterium]